MSKKITYPIVKRGPLASVFICPHCGHTELGRGHIPYDKTRADGRARTHIANCAKREVAT